MMASPELDQMTNINGLIFPSRIPITHRGHDGRPTGTSFSQEVTMMSWSLRILSAVINPITT